jgi:hypothetical protein
MWSSAVNRGYSGISWARNPIPARNPGSCRGAPPRTEAVPPVGLTSPASSRSSVVLPAPFGPTSAHTRPSGTATEHSVSALTRR